MKNKKISREVNGITVEQRLADGFLNATAMCATHGKDLTQWFRTKETLELFCALLADNSDIFNPVDLQDLDISRLSGSKYSEMFPSLITSKRGSPQAGGGTWLHPDLAIQLAQWCSPAFAIQVSRWIREWMTTGQNPMWAQQDIDRVLYRDALKDEARLRMTDEVKIYLQQIQRYDDQKFRGEFFARVHDAINIAITGETAKSMRIRVSQILGREVKECELIRDYFPALVLQKYISICESSANYMLRDQLEPLVAVEKAIDYALPANYLPTPIDFVEHINFVRQRLSQPSIGSGGSGFDFLFS